MNWLDIVLLCLAGIGFIKGLFDGIIKQVVSLIALLVGIFFCGKAAAWIRGYLVDLGWFPTEGITIASYILGFVLIVGVLVLVGEILHKAIEVTPLSILNHLSGGFMGFVVTLVFFSLFLNILDVIDRGSALVSRETKVESKLYYSIKKIVPTIYPQSYFYFKAG